MKFLARSLFLALWTLAQTATGQSLTVLGGPLNAGATATISVSNSLPGATNYFQGPTPLHVMQPTGELVYPLTALSIQTQVLGVGQSTTISLPIPASGPGSQGSFVLHYRDGHEAVTRLDVESAPESFPQIHMWPANMHDFYLAHGALPNPLGHALWKIANIGSTAFTFSSDDALYVFRPQLSSPVRTTPLRGVSVPAGGVIKLDVNLSGLSAGPFRVLGIWNDPGSQKLESRSHGFRMFGSRVDMHFPGGKTVKLGEPLPVILALRAFPSTVSSFTGGVPFYAIVLSNSSGATQLLPGLTVPVPITNTLVGLSIGTGVSGILSNNVGQASPVVSPQTPIYTGMSMAPFCTITHPKVPWLSGRSYFCAAVAFDPVSGVWGASQQELITFE